MRADRPGGKTIRSWRMPRGLIVAAILILPLAGVRALGVDDRADAFLADTGRAMATMDAGMMTKPTRDVDHDFVAMMVPHHQGAIDMAVAELRYGQRQQLKRIAQEIIVDQEQEIAAMRLALGQPLPPGGAAPTQSDRSTTATHDVAAGQEH